MFWMLDIRTLSLRQFFEYPQHMFWLRNRKIIFNCTLLDRALEMLYIRPIKNCKNKNNNSKLEDLTVLKRSPDLLNNVKIGQDQLRL